MANRLHERHAHKPKSEFQKWEDMIAAYEKILHPDFYNPIRMQLNKVYEESKENAYKTANISPLARWVHDELKRLVEDAIQDKRRDFANEPDRPFNTWRIKLFYKQLLKRIENETNNN